MSIGNLKDSGNQGNNFPWQLKMLLGQQCACDELSAINANTNQVEFLLSAILTALQDGTDYEAKFVIDTCDSDKIYLEVRIWDPTPAPGSWGPITYYLPGSSTPVTPVGEGTPGCLQYTDPTGVLGQILAELQLQTPILSNIESNTTGLATEVTLGLLEAKDFATETTLALLEGKDFATETTLNNLDSKITACDTTNLTTETTLLSVDSSAAQLVTNTTPVNRTPGILSDTGAGATPTPVYSFSIANVGGADGVVDGVTIPAGVTISFDGGGLNNTLDPLSYNASGTTFIITYIS